MEIRLQIPDDYCQGEAGYLEPLEDEDIPLEDRRSKVKSIRVKRDGNK